MRRYIGEWRRPHTAPTVYLPLSWEPGADAQADWGDGEVVMAGQPTKVALCSLRLCYSRRVFVRAFPTPKVEAFLDAQGQAFRFFEGVPRRLSDDNLKSAVKSILTGHNREEQANFRAFRSHYLFESHFCNPGQGHEKGGVEHAVGYGRRNFRVPIPQVDSFEELNAHLLAQCLADEERTVHGQAASIRDAWQSEKEYLLPLPAQDYPCCISQEVRLTPYGPVVFETNRYSVPASEARITLTLRAYPFQVEILREGQVIAHHARCYGHSQDIFDPLHYLPLLARRPGAFDYANPLREWRERWSPVYEQLLTRLRTTWPDGRGIREFIQILQLHSQYSAEDIETALHQALSYGCIHYEGVRLCLNQLVLPNPQFTPLNLQALELARLEPSLAQPIDLQQYDQLIGEN